jgi:uncharacterized membrane protein
LADFGFGANLAAMTPKWERVAGPPPLAGDMLMDVVLRPNRSLSRTAFRLMLIVVIAVNAAVGAVFALQGAYPVAGFLGLDVAALWLAFHLNYRAARAEERVRVAPGQVHLARRSAKGATDHWVLNPIWARVEDDARAVVVASGGARMRLAAFLSPDERLNFKRALDAALWRAKKGPMRAD